MKYDTLEKVEKRIDELLADKGLQHVCQDLEKRLGSIDAVLVLAEKVADIDIKGIQPDRGMIEGQEFFTEDDIVASVEGFYEWIDFLAPEGEQLEKLTEGNRQYLEIFHNSDIRSYCGIDDQGNKWIKVNMENRLSDAGTAIHEFCHSLSENFTQFKPRKDNRMAEVSTVMTDSIGKRFLSKKFPQYQTGYNELQIEDNLQNVRKARQSMVEGALVKLMLGQSTKQEVLKVYRKYYGDNFNMISKTLEAVDEALNPNSTKHIEQPLYETRYLIPQVISLEMAERFDENPEAVAKLFKEVLAKDCDITLEECLKMLGLPEKENLLEDYANKFQDRIDKLMGIENDL